MAFLVFSKNKFRVRLSFLIGLVLVMLLLSKWMKISNMGSEMGSPRQHPWSKNGAERRYDAWIETKDLPLARSIKDVNCNSKVFGNEMCPIHYNSLSSCDRYESYFVCPDIRRQINGTVRQAQLVTVRMLRMLDCIASKYGIRYWLEGNSLLGVYRHEGCVPWIIGIEVGIHHKDVLKFIKLSSYIPFPGISILGQLDTSPGNSMFEVITKSSPGLNKMKYLQLRDESSCYKKCPTSKCKWMGGLTVSLRVSSDARNVFPLCRMAFEGWFFPVPCSKEYLDALKYHKASHPNMYGDPFHSCNELKRNRNKTKRNEIK